MLFTNHTRPQQFVSLLLVTHQKVRPPACKPPPATWGAWTRGHPARPASAAVTAGAHRSGKDTCLCVNVCTASHTLLHAVPEVRETSKTYTPCPLAHHRASGDLPSEGPGRTPGTDTAHGNSRGRRHESTVKSHSDIGPHTCTPGAAWDTDSAAVTARPCPRGPLLDDKGPSIRGTDSRLSGPLRLAVRGAGALRQAPSCPPPCPLPLPRTGTPLLPAAAPCPGRQPCIRTPSPTLPVRTLTHDPTGPQAAAHQLQARIHAGTICRENESHPSTSQDILAMHGPPCLRQSRGPTTNRGADLTATSPDARQAPA